MEEKIYEEKKRVDNLPVFPRNAVPAGTEALLTSVFEMGTGEQRSYGRPVSLFSPLIYKDYAEEVIIFKNVKLH